MNEDTSVQCDFCNVTEVAWHFECPNFYDPSGLGLSVGAWGACQGCYQLIMDGKWAELIANSVDTHPFIISGMIERESVIGYVTKLHAEFRRLMTGKVIAV